MRLIIRNYVVEVTDAFVDVQPIRPGSRLQRPQRVTHGQVNSIKPKYVREEVYVRIQHIGLIYVIHFDEPYKHAKHYLGFTRNLDKRMLRHEAGRGARLMQVIEEAGITWRIAGVWFGDRYEERRMKKHSSTRYCQVCREGVT